MKKVWLIVCVLLLVVACGKKNTNEEAKEDEIFVLKLVDEDKPYVYSDVVESYVLSNGDKYDLEMIYVNLNSVDASNVNMELRSFINKSYKNYVVENDKLKSGNIISYDFYKTDDYLSLVVNYKFLINNKFNDDKSMVYVLTLDKGKILKNKDLLSNYSLTEEELFKEIEDTIESEDSLYTMKSIKDNGYYLYVNNDNKLVVLFYENTDEESIKKELILD
jgi:hypothetical protein